MKNFDNELMRLTNNTISQDLKKLRGILLKSFIKGMQSVDPKLLIRKSIEVKEELNTSSKKMLLKGFNGIINN